MMYAIGRLGLALVAISIGVGCGSGADDGKRVPVFRVTGKITRQGRPLAQAMVSFSPKEGQPVAYATTNDAGEFSLSTYASGDGAAAGTYAVVVNKPSVSGAPKTDIGHSADPTQLGTPQAAHDEAGSGPSESLVPDNYTDAINTPLSATVDPSGKNQFSFNVD
jgi:hypothetical protein